MAYAKLAALAVLVVLLWASTGTVARSSPAVSTSKVDGMPGVMTVNGFERGEDGGGPAECDGKYHSDDDMLVALPTGLYQGGARCFKMIRITSAGTGRSVEAMVVDECDSRKGCKNNIVDTSKAVWKALGLDTNVGEVPVTWSDV
ncbi:putative ripening-related protein 6 [Aegilops tauschii subsp. strangulata]|nr:putative ripening-related protein 6 [Aegilops tauschii subsp. strangulata]